MLYSLFSLAALGCASALGPSLAYRGSTISRVHGLGGGYRGAPVRSEVGEKVPLYLYLDEYSSVHNAADFSSEFTKLAEAGVSHIILAFYVTDNPGFPDNYADTVLMWSQLTDADRKDILDKIHSYGSKLLISLGGESVASVWQTHEATSYASEFCQKAKALGADGVDFDLEGLPPMFGPSTMQWVSDATAACRPYFPDLITSAPQSPYVDPAWAHGISGGGWADIVNTDHPQDRFLIQYYNQPSYPSTDYDSLFTKNAYSIKQLMAKYPSAPPNTFVVGKPLLTGDGAEQDVAKVQDLRNWVCRAWNELGWRGGLMFWRHHWGTGFDDYKTLSAPCSGAAPAPPAPAPTPITTTTTPTSTTTTTTSTTTTTPRPIDPIHPATTTNKAATAVNPEPNSSDLVSNCESMIDAIPGYEFYSDVCKSKCADYSPSGVLAPWCPNPSTSAELAQCVVTQATYCLKH